MRGRVKVNYQQRSSSRAAQVLLFPSVSDFMVYLKQSRKHFLSSSTPTTGVQASLYTARAFPTGSHAYLPIQVDFIVG